MTITVQFSNARITLWRKNVLNLYRYLNAVAHLGVVLVFNELCCGVICIRQGYPSVMLPCTLIKKISFCLNWIAKWAATRCIKKVENN